VGCAPYAFAGSCQTAALGFEKVLKALIEQFKMSSAIPPPRSGDHTKRVNFS
jgi:hypothetical protein